LKNHIETRATKLQLTHLKSIPIQTFWISSLAFFLCFFAWFGIVPFMPDVVKDLNLSEEQKWNSIILAVSATVIARLLIGKLCDRYGPRLCYTFLLILGAIPVFCTALVQTPFQFMLCRFFTGFIGASFVVTQVHTSLMFAPNIIGTANATSAGWGNLGGGANRLGMPIIAAVVIGMGISEAQAWRYSMMIVGVLCLLMGLVYYHFTQDTVEGNFKDLIKQGKNINKTKKDEIGFLSVVKDYRVWILFMAYAACFGIELTVYGTMDDYLQNSFQLSRVQAGNMILIFGLMNIFARTLGGYFGDKFGNHSGLKGRVHFLVIILITEGVILSIFSSITTFTLGLCFLLSFSLSVQMAEGATFSVVPLINKKAIGTVSGIVGAGGNVGAFVAALFLKSKTTSADTTSSFIPTNTMASGYFILGIAVTFIGLGALIIRFYKPSKKTVTKPIKKSEPLPT